jgi:hypothetical protein
MYFYIYLFVYSLQKKKKKNICNYVSFSASLSLSGFQIYPSSCSFIGGRVKAYNREIGHSS